MATPKISQHKYVPLTDAQLHAELAKCLTCRNKPCRTACPCHCDPCEFIEAARAGDVAPGPVGAPSDMQISAAHIMQMNPFGTVCGAVCPDSFCMSACTRKDIDAPVNIPAVQAAIVSRARALGVPPLWPPNTEFGPKKVAVIGAGPSGLAAASVVSRAGFPVTVFDKRPMAGGACNTIPEDRLPRDLLKADIAWVENLGGVTMKLGTTIEDPKALLGNGEYSAVCIAAGLNKGKTIGAKNEQHALDALDYLWSPDGHKEKLGRKVAIIGGGAVAVDVAATVKKCGGVEDVIIFYRRSLGEMPLTSKERQCLLDNDVTVYGRTLPTEIKIGSDGKVCGVTTKRVELPHRSTGKTSAIDIPNSAASWDDITCVIYAIGNKPSFDHEREGEGGDGVGVFYAGDVVNGASTVVQASASGKNVGEKIIEFLKSDMKTMPVPHDCPMKSVVGVPGYEYQPVSLDTTFFGHPIRSPYILSAAPLTDGYEQVVDAYKAGWAGVVMKTAFDGVPIHIPSHYMDRFNDTTYGNSDNVSGHPLERVCGEVKRLVKEWPDRMTMASTGGPVSGNDAFDKAGWQSNTKKLEDAGCHAVEYSLSCPQGGDSGDEDTQGSIVSQNPLLAAKIIDWVMEISQPHIPKIFKLTGAVTSIKAVLLEIRKVFAKYPEKKGGITLANSFPGATFRSRKECGDTSEDAEKWEGAIVMGLSGEGVTPISNLSLCDAHGMGFTISGNGGPFNYMQASHFLALGCETVQFCTLPTRYGIEVLPFLENATSHMLQARGIASIKELIGRAGPKPIIDFMDLTPVKQISTLNKDACVNCGNCTRCPYLAISMDKDNFPVIDASKCISCGVCTQQCPGYALSLKDRTPEQAAVLNEEW